MMDQKYLEEIKARCDAGRPTARIDVKALIVEVERLSAYENIDLLPEQIEAMQGHNIALIEENAVKDQQIATLKKALEKLADIVQDEIGPGDIPWVEWATRQAQEQEGQK